MHDAVSRLCKEVNKMEDMSEESIRAIDVHDKLSVYKLLRSAPGLQNIYQFTYQLFANPTLVRRLSSLLDTFD